MAKSPTQYGFRYRFRGKNYGVMVEAESIEEASERIRAMSEAEFVSDLVAISDEVGAESPYATSAD